MKRNGQWNNVVVEICKLWFGQDFIILSVEISAYPFVDLISEDKKLFVQVSTAQDIPS